MFKAGSCNGVTQYYIMFVYFRMKHAVHESTHSALKNVLWIIVELVSDTVQDKKKSVEIN